MDLVKKIIERAKSDKQRIVLPEATEERTLRAADRVLADDVADIILIGNPEEINSLAAKWGLGNIGKATIVDPDNNPKAEEYAAQLAELRKKKGMTIEQARELVKNPLYLGCMIIKTGGADGQISGALSTTADTLRPALQIIKCRPGITCVSGAMLLITKQPQYGEDGGRRAWPALPTRAWPCLASLPRAAHSTRWWTRWWRPRRRPRSFAQR